MKIFVNPGHDRNVEPGVCANGLREADIAYSIGKLVDKYLTAAGLTVKLCQVDGLQAICDAANAWNADLFVSIHCNGAQNVNANGSETYFYYGSPGGKSLADAVHSQIVKNLPVTNRGVKTANFYVLIHTSMPAVLVETAFLTNSRDADILITKQDEFARAIVRGILDFVNIPAPDVIDVPKYNVTVKKSTTATSHFDASEFVCHCCGRGSVDKRLIELLELLRSAVGNVPVVVNCGYRCPKHNREVGGVENSQHVLGTAADITVPLAGYERTKRAVRQLDFDGTGFYPPIGGDPAWFIHVDVRDGGIGSHIEWED